MVPTNMVANWYESMDCSLGRRYHHVVRSIGSSETGAKTGGQQRAWESGDGRTEATKGREVGACQGLLMKDSQVPGG